MVALLADGTPPGLEEILRQAVTALLKAYPWLAWLLIGLIVVYCAVGIVRAATSEESRILFGLISWKTESRKMRELSSNLDEVVTSNRFLGLLLLIVRRSIVRYDAIRHKFGTSTNEDGLHYLCDWITRAMSFESVDINKVVLFKVDGANLIVLAQSGLSDESARQIKLPINPPHPDDDTFAALAVRSGEVQVCDDVDSDARYRPLARPPAHPYKSILAVPVYHGASVIGCVTIDSLAASRFGPDEQDQGKLFASLFGLFM